MPIPVERAHQLLHALEAEDLTNFVLQSDARHLLLEVGEAPENFPSFTADLESRVTSLAYLLLSIGCSLAESEDRPTGIDALAKAARLLRNVHGPSANASRESAFHMLVGSMAAYAAGQYSWAFVILRDTPEMSLAASVVGAFLRRDRGALHSRIAEVLLSDRGDPDDVIEEAITRAIARALAHTAEFTFTGHDHHLERAHRELDDGFAIAAEGDSPALWWMIRLLRLMINDLWESSPWSIVPPHIPDEEDGNQLIDRYIRLLTFDHARPVIELWRSQRDALPEALGDNRGAVVSLRTSGGKTRIAELAMLQVLAASAESKILYLAPFRSLAFELEHTLSRTFHPLGFRVSHLYGGSRASRGDAELAAEAQVIVATPEKSRALLRANPDLFAEIGLIIVDEAHQLGGDARGVRNEMYMEHLRARAKATGARIIFLSAVLPNADQMARWIAYDANLVGSSEWRPSTQRFALLGWNGSRVRLDWRGDYESYNPNFVTTRPSSTRQNAKLFPSDKNEAVAATAVRLATEGRPVMIFTAQARSVPPMARAVLKADKVAGLKLVHAWPDREWRVFETLCTEELPEEAIELEAARQGIICHSNRLPAQVRLAMERLMREGTPRIVIATSTLAQGVNLGVTTVIIANLMRGHSDYVGLRDFWNIAGRAGRAFVDIEGKILWAIDETAPRRKVRAQIARAEEYFAGSTEDRVVSGVLQLVDYLRTMAAEVGVDFARLLELAAEDDFGELANHESDAVEICDLLDDALLTLHEDEDVNDDGEPPAVWVEKVFRESLGVLQANALKTATTSDQLLAFLRARAISALRRAPSAEHRKAVVFSSLPLTTALQVFGDIAFWQGLGGDFDEATLGEAVEAAEEWLRDTGGPFTDDMPEQAVLDLVRHGWLTGTPLRTLCGTNQEAHKACRDFYGFKLPWLLHAASQQVRAAGNEEDADKLGDLSLSVELGLPSKQACLVFLAGVRSRRAAAAIAALGLELGDTLHAVRGSLQRTEIGDIVRRRTDDATFIWLTGIRTESGATEATEALSFAPFVLKGADTDECLYVRSDGDNVCLSSVDGRFSRAVSDTADWPFSKVANDPRYCFVYSDYERVWQLYLQDPRLRETT